MGTVKKVTLSAFSRPRNSGLIALELNDGDRLIGAAITSGDDDVMLISSVGKAMRFHEDDVRPMGRTARGVRGIRMADENRVIALIIPQPEGVILTASVNGYGKKTRVDDFPVKGRGGQGVIAQQYSDRNGNLAGAVQVFSGDDVMLISDKGTLVRTRTEEISELGRNTQGVTLIRVSDDESLVGLARIEEPEDVEETAEGDEGASDAEATNAPETESPETSDDV